MTAVFKAGGCVGGTAKRPAWLEHGEPGDVAGLAVTRSGGAGGRFEFLLFLAWGASRCWLLHRERCDLITIREGEAGCGLENRPKGRRLAPDAE